MSLSVNDFWSRIAASGIADADECRTLAIGFAQDHGGSPPADARELARHLVHTKRLTAYQAKALLTGDGSAGDNGALRIGDFVVTQPMSQPPFQGWFWARPRTPKQPASLLYPFRQGTAAAANSDWLRFHQAVESPHLQAVELVGESAAGDPSGGGCVASALPPGQPLETLLTKGRRLDEATVRRLGLSVGGALRALHDGGIPHGAVHPERIWIGNDRRVWLLRDATGPATTPFENRPGWFRPLKIPALYAAPEFSVPGQASDPLTDQYALGCLLWHVRTGKPPQAASETDALIRQHTLETPEPLQRAVRAGAAGDPLLRVIAHAMSKNREGRFPEIAGLLAALETLETLAASQQAASGERPSDEANTAPSPASSGAAAVAAAVAAEPPPKAGGSAAIAQRATEKETAVALPAAAERLPAAAERLPAAAERPPATAASRPKPVSRRRKKNKQAPLMIGGLGFLVMVLMLLVLVTRNGGGPAEETRPSRPPVAYQPPPPRVDRERSSEPAPPAAGSSAAYQLVDDPNALWLPPSSAEAPPLRMIPPGPQMVVSVRLRHVLDSPAGEQMLAAIDRELGDAWDRLEARTGVPAEQIERLTLALEGAGDGEPAAALGVELAAPVPLDELQERWNAASARTPEGVTLFAGEERAADAYFVAGDSLQPDTPVDRFAVGTLDQIKLVAELQGGPIPLPRSLERLWRSADADADLIVMGTPNFLFADGRKMLARYASESVDPLKRFLLPDVAGLMLTTTLQPQWYAEVRLAPGARTSAATLVQQLKASVQQWPRWAEQFLIDASPDVSWKGLAVRLPQMMFAVSDHARFGVSDGHAVGNLYLPAIAAPNVSLAVLLAVNTPAGAANPAGMESRSEPALTLEQMLERPMSIRFDQESLEVAAKAILDEFASELPDTSQAPEIFVIGGDLEKEGITQNQQIRDFDLAGKKLRAVLTELVMRANPVTTVQAPTEEDQKLVWVVGPHPDAPEQQAILITTRGAARDKYALPTEFVAE